MDAHLAYWTGAWLNMALMLGLAATGVRAAQQGDGLRHRGWMLAAASLVVLFVGSYAAKLFWLGREQLETWSAHYVVALRVHEACVAVMLAAGLTALVLARRLGLPGPVPPEKTAQFELHRRAGRIGVRAAALGVVTAGYVLYGMFER